jgi:non-specific serine/threonine protein kinase
VLLVLDNFEHLAGSGAPLVHTLLARVPNLTCLVTSRQRLLLDGEREFALPPLATPKTEKYGDHTPESLLAYPSVALFVSRAQAARPDFALTPRNAEAVARLCQRLEGIPLALELAAAWTQTLTPAQMLERLERRFDLLVSRRRDAPGRHATLRATIEWSWGLLPPDLQRFFAQLSVFRGGWTLEAAEAVTGDPNALLYLTELRERSLVVSDEEDLEEEPPCDPDAPVENAPVVTATTEEAAAGMRFRMLESLREFASERLNESGERAALAARHLAYFLRLAEAAGPHLRGPGQISWLRRLETDHDNLRAALDWSFRSSGTRNPAQRPASAIFPPMRAFVWPGRSPGSGC